MHEDSGRCVLVHGGGAEVTRISRLLGIESVFIEGVRQTGVEEMNVVDMVLSGRMNKMLVRAAVAAGIPAVGISGSDGGLFIGKSIDSENNSRTGTIIETDGRLLQLLLEGGYVPVISTTSMDKDGGGLNINADEAALAAAIELEASCLLFVSDVAGIVKKGRILEHIRKEHIEDEIRSGTITGGMVPKARASAAALRRNVETIVIGTYSEKGDFRKLLDGQSGTRLT
jgi:acetylglutamate kinase